MKNLLPRLCVMLLLVIVTSCEEENLHTENQIINQQNEKIFIDGVEYNFVFKENILGEISLAKNEGDILSSFIEENKKMSYYYDMKGALHLFKNSDEMKVFMENDSKSNFVPIKNKKNSLLKIVGNDEWAESSLKIYDGKNYQTLLFSSNLGNTNSGWGGTSTYIPNLGSVYLSGYQDFNDKASSIKLSMIVPYPHANNIDISYAILYRETNYGGYSLGISTSKYSEYGIADLHRKKMYRRWAKTRYWGNRASSLKHYY